MLLFLCAFSVSNRIGHKCVESGKHASFGLEIHQDEIKLSGEGEQEKHQCMEMNNGSQEGQLETDFQKELREIMETEEVRHTQMVANMF